MIENVSIKVFEVKQGLVTGHIHREKHKGTEGEGEVLKCRYPLLDFVMINVI